MTIRTLTLDEFNSVHTGLLKAHAMLEMIYGEGLEVFDCLSSKQKDSCIWLCSDAVGQALQMMERSEDDRMASFDKRN